MADSITLSYLKGEITFEEYANLVENQNLRNELLNETIIESDAASNLEDSLRSEAKVDKSKFKKAVAGKATTSKKVNFLDDELDELNSDTNNNEDDEDDIWRNFDVGTLDFNKFIDSNDTDDDGSNQGPSSRNSNNKFPKQMASSAFSPRKRKKELASDEDAAELKSKRRRNRVLPIEIQGLMGEANIAFARGETNKAIDICTEVIKHAPKASEPFQLLSLLYSEIGDNDKALRVALIAAQLNKDPDEWIQLIQQSIMAGNEEIVLFCYNNAIQCNPQNVSLHLERLRLLEEKRDFKRLIIAKLMLLKYLNVTTHSDLYNKYFNETYQDLNDESDKYKKIYLLKNDMKKFKENFPIERLTTLLRLLIEQKSYKDPILIVLNQCYITTKNVATNTVIPPTAIDFTNIKNYDFDVSDYIDPYVRALFITALISLGYDREESLLSQLIQTENEKYGLYYLLIAEKYYEKELYQKSKSFFQIILNKMKQYMTKIDIWIKYGNCCKYLQETHNAINAYRNAVSLDSSNCEAAILLVELLKKNILFDEASNVIRTTLNHEKSKTLTHEIINLMVSECFILYEKQSYEEFTVNARHLLYGNILKVLEPDNINSLLRSDSKAQRILIFHQILEENNMTMNFNYSKLKYNIQNNIYEVFHKLCNLLIKTKQYHDLLMYTIGATVLPFIYERPDWIKPINFNCLIACILKSDGKNGFNILREFIIENRNSNKLWSYVCIIIGLYPSLNQQKFFIRLSAKYMDHLPLCLINAHFAIMSGTYRYALVEYMNCYKQNPTDPFVNLIIAITYCHISCQKYNTKRHLLVSQSLVFLRRYMEHRGECQETYYNVARIMHQLSLFDLAASFYRKCLTYECPFEQEKDVYDLKRIAAYNLVSIYKSSGSLTLASRIMKDYLTI